MFLLRCIFCIVAIGFSGAAWSAGACAETLRQKTTQELDAMRKVAKDRGFLWRISKSGRSSYLYGTTHINRSEWTYPGPLTIKALHASDRIALELDFSSDELMRRGNAGVAVNYSSELPENYVARIKKIALDTCFPLDKLASLHPVWQHHFLMMEMFKQSGLYAGYGADLVLIEYATAAKKPVESLETPEASGAGLPPEPNRQAFLAAIHKGLKRIEDGTSLAITQKMTVAWAESDSAALSSYISWCKCARNAKEIAAYQRLIDDRNPGMAANLDKLHASGQRVFAGAGALHMFGPKALPSLMAERGYKVERVF